MRHLVNGVETELAAAEEAEVTSLGDRLYVRAAGRTRSALSVRQGATVLVSFAGRVYRVEAVTATSVRRDLPHDGRLKTPMPGQVVDVFVAEGDQVEVGQRLLVIEAMKMQHPIKAPFAGRVRMIDATKGQQVEEGRVVAHVEQENSATPE